MTNCIGQRCENSIHSMKYSFGRQSLPMSSALRARVKKDCSQGKCEAQRTKRPMLILAPSLPKRTRTISPRRTGTVRSKVAKGIGGGGFVILALWVPESHNVRGGR